MPKFSNLAMNLHNFLSLGHLKIIQFIKVRIFTFRSVSLIVKACKRPAYGLLLLLLALLMAALFMLSKAPYIHLQSPMNIPSIYFLISGFVWLISSNILTNK